MSTKILWNYFTCEIACLPTGLWALRRKREGGCGAAWVLAAKCWLTRVNVTLMHYLVGALRSHGFTTWPLRMFTSSSSRYLTTWTSHTLSIIPPRHSEGYTAFKQEKFNPCNVSWEWWRDRTIQMWYIPSHDSVKESNVLWLCSRPFHCTHKICHQVRALASYAPRLLPMVSHF